MSDDPTPVDDQGILPPWSDVAGAQRLRLRRLTQGLLSYAMTVVALIVITELGLGHMTWAQWGLYVGGILGGCAVFFVLIRTGLNLRYRDPSMTKAQIICAALWGTILLYSLPDARPLMLMLFLPAFSFGMFRLSGRGYAVVFAVTMVLYAGLLTVEHVTGRPGFEPAYELFLFVFFGIILAWFSTFGWYLSRMRRRLHAQNRRIEREVEERRRAQDEQERLIGEYREALAKVKRLSGLYHEILETIQEGYFQVDLAGNMLFANGALCRLFGYDHDELIGMNNREYMDEQNARTVFRTFNEVYRTGEPREAFDWEIIRKDGERRLIEASVTPVRGADGEPYAFRGMVRDVTRRREAEEEREKLEEQLRQSQRMEAVGRLAGGVAHDLNNLLVPILGRGELLLETIENDGRAERSLRQIVDAALRARKLVAQLLAFVGRQALEVKPIDLNRVLDNFHPLLRRTIREDIEIELVTASKLPAVKADVSQLEQVVMNLAVNAQDAMPRGGSLVIETGLVELDAAYAAEHPGVTPGRYVMLAVSDTGHGMDPETMRRVFEPFFTTKEKGRGTGLGLSTVYGILKQHGGNVWVYSEPGRGTTFKCYLRAEERSAEPSDEHPKRSDSAASGETIVVVEDDPLVRDLAVDVLESQGYAVVSAAGEAECLEKLESLDGSVDLVLSDVVMPESDGKAVVGRVRQRYPDAKALYMSGYTENVIADRGILEEGVTFIQKPFTVRDLLKAVRQLLDRD